MPDRRRGAAPARSFPGSRHMAGLERFVELGLVAQLPRDLEVFGVLDGGEDRASDVARFLQQHRGRQIARRGVDRVAEQCELQERYRNHRGERDAVAPQLQQFLAQHGADAAQEAAGSDDGRAHYSPPPCGEGSRVRVARRHTREPISASVGSLASRLGPPRHPSPTRREGAARMNATSALIGNCPWPAP